MVVSKATVSAKKGHVTRALRACNELISEDGIDVINLELAIQNLKEKLSSYGKIYDEYETQELEKGSETDFEPEYESHLNFENDSLKQLSKFINIAEKCKGNSQQLSHTSAVKPKLPSLNLVKFGGDLLEWVPFWDSFRSLVDNRSDLDDVQKMTYLRSSLFGPALELIAGYQTSRASYVEAVQALKDSYADDDRIKQHLCHLLLDMKPSAYNLKELTSYLNEYQSIIRNLKQYVPNVQESNWLLQEMLLRKLPSEVEALLFSKLNKHYFSVDEVEQGIKDAIQHLSKLKDKQEIRSVPPNKEKKAKQQTVQPNTVLPINRGRRLEQSTSQASAVGSYQLENRELKENQCLFCQGDHYGVDCSQYTTLNEKRDRLKELGRCARCTSKTHEAKHCGAIINTCRRCNRGKHHVALCLKSGSKKLSNDKQQATTQQSVLSVKGNALSKSTALPTATVEVYNEKTKQSVTTRAFFDQGSQMTFIAKELANKLGLESCKTMKLALSGFLKSQEHNDFEIVRTVIRLGNRVKRLEAVVMENLPNTIHTPGLKAAVEKLEELGVPLVDQYINEDKLEGIEILIGADYYDQFVTGLAVKDNISLLKCSGGCMIYGKIPCEQRGENIVQNIVVARMSTQVIPTEVTDMIEENTEPIHKLWDLDTIGIKQNEPSPEDNISYQAYLDTLKYENNKYWVRLPWKVNCPSLPTNYSMALGQLKSITKALKDQNDLKNYHDIIQTQLENDFIEKIEPTSITEHCHYLPHHAVKKDSLTTPIRMVFNCSAKQGKNPSLNDCLMTGPSLTEKLGNILLRFRTERFAYSADISKAFLRVGLQECDRDYTRFLWYENLEKEGSLATYRFKSVLFGATCSPFLLQATLDHHFRNSDNDYKDTLRQNFYMDNLLGTTNTQNELFAIYHNANLELEKANMPLRMWVSNDPDLNSKIMQDYPDYEIPRFNQILGLRWDLESDMISIKPLAFVDHSSLSKRKLLSLISTVFDPLGFLTPVTVRGKLLLREAWKLETSWDEHLPVSFVDAWNKLKKDYEKLSELKLPRMVAQADFPCDLHVFCDASSVAYGAVAYLISGERGEIVTSKTRVAPLKARTLPQLELTALQVGTQLANHIRDALKVNVKTTVIWSDNEAALQWLRNNNSSIPYVRNRVAVIRDLSQSFQYKYVPSKSNIADLLSRGVSWDTFLSRDEWFKGPAWLGKPCNWPEQKHEIISVHTAVSESCVLPNILFEASTISSLGRILRITDKVFKFLSILKPTIVLPTSIDYWVSVVQRECFRTEWEQLTTGRTISNSSALIKALGLYIDPLDNLIHCRGRLQHCEADHRIKFPVLLPRHSWLTTLLVRQFHIQCLHGGVADTLASLREQYWLPKGRQVIKSLIKNCVVCKAIEGKSLKLPSPPPLPKERVVHLEPFRTVGVDYSGPITITLTEDGIPRKYYICLFTCATTRAVHLEMAKDLTSVTFLHLLRRFVARRSTPKTILSDNATNFTATSKFLKELYNDPLVKTHCHDRNIDWKFLPPGAPWMGGFYERMIGSVKNCIRKVLYKKKISEDELMTVLAEVEMRINNRPLTYIDDDIDHPVPLTPSHLIYGRRLNPMPNDHDDYSDDPEYLGCNELNERYNYLSKLLRHWEDVWKREYLVSLREKFYGAQAKTQQINLQVGDVIIVESEGPRSTWPLGRILKIFRDGENKVRVVEVLSKGITRVRTLDKLIPLELSSPISDNNSPDRKSDEGRPKRQAAKLAEKAIHDMITSNLVTYVYD